MDIDADIQRRLVAQNRFLSKLSDKRRRNVNLATNTQLWLKRNPITVNGEPVELQNTRLLADLRPNWNQAPEFFELWHMSNTLANSGMVLVAMFNDSGRTHLSPLACHYSRHRFDSMWAYRKTQLLRQRYSGYLQANPQLIKDYRPSHLTLTVPHAGGTWQDKTFYGKELVKAFNDMRKENFWKRNVVGGEYGVEITNSSKNGLHIHLHGLVLQSRDISRNEFYQRLDRYWNKKVGNTRTNSHSANYSGLYAKKTAKEWYFVFHRELVENMKYGESLTTIPEHGQWVEQTIRYKHYFGDNATARELLPGIMECIKYHYKPSTGWTTKGFDFELIGRLLVESRGFRFHSRFGCLYGEQGLAMAHVPYREVIDEETGEVTFEHTQPADDEAEALEPIALTEEPDEDSEKLKGDVENAVSKLVNPYTWEPAGANDFQLAICRPEDLTYTRTDSYRLESGRVWPLNTKSIKNAVKLLFAGGVASALQGSDYSFTN